MFTELSLTVYYPADLLDEPLFMARVADGLMTPQQASHQWPELHWSSARRCRANLYKRRCARSRAMSGATSNPTPPNTGEREPVCSHEECCRSTSIHLVSNGVRYSPRPFENPYTSRDLPRDA